VTQILRQLFGIRLLVAKIKFDVNANLSPKLRLTADAGGFKQERGLFSPQQRGEMEGYRILPEP